VTDELYRKARVRAAEEDTSVSAVVRKYLEDYTEKDSEFKRLEKLQKDTIAKILRKRSKPPYISASDRLTREELYDRDALRRHQRSRL
jgi:hypothetical protein